MKAGLGYDNVSVLLSRAGMEYREQLKNMLREKSFVRERVVLSSGKVSDYYFDCKLTTLSPRGAFLTGQTILELLESNDIQADAIGGPEIGAIPIVAAVAAISHTRGKPLPAFLVRKEPKGHGRRKQIEGIDLADIHRVVIIDEVCTEGASIEVALKAVEEEKLEVAAVISLVDRQEGGYAKLKAKYGDRYLPVFTTSDFLQDSSVHEPALRKSS
jgi:orotate phosphoribosyltransferase